MVSACTLFLFRGPVLASHRVASHRVAVITKASPRSKRSPLLNYKHFSFPRPVDHKVHRNSCSRQPALAVRPFAFRGGARETCGQAVVKTRCHDHDAEEPSLRERPPEKVVRCYRCLYKSSPAPAVHVRTYSQAARCSSRKNRSCPERCENGL